MDGIHGVTRALAALSAAVLSGGCGGGAEGPSPRPNVLLISLDSARRDLFSCYGRVPEHAPSLPTSPHIDRLAAEGVRFENAYSTSSWTLPSHMALLTGQPDLVHGVEHESLSLHTGRPTLAELLAEEGYRTAGFFSGPYLSPAYGFDRGFERYEACYGDALERAVEAQKRIEAKLDEETEDRAARARLAAEMMGASTLVEELSHTDVTSRAVTDAVLEELEAARADGRPWFLFAHYFDPHYDYVPPPPHDRRFDPDYAGDVDGRNFYTNPAVSVVAPAPNQPQRRARTIDGRDLEHVLALYEGELEWTDAQVGRLLEDLRRGGELDDTVVIVTADHGDEFFEHGNIGHRRTLYEEVLRVPLILRYPPVFPAGTEVAGVTSIVHVYATVLELLGVAPPEGVFSRSLVPMLEAAGDPTRGRAVGRLVDMDAVPTRDGPGLLVRVRDSYLRWPIKIRRLRRWVEPTPATPADARREVRERADRDRGRDARLAWVDLERSPLERPEDWSSDFGDPRAEAVLEEFQALYRSMTELRMEPRTAEDGAPESLLGGLGYASSSGFEPPDALLESFLLPPPGSE